MSDLKKIFGTSVMSVLLVIWGLFMVCSGRVPDVNYDDEFLSDETGTRDNSGQSDNSQLLSQLAVLDKNESTNLENNQRNEILDALGISPSGSEISRKEEQDFLSEDLFLDLEVEIAELEKMTNKKTSIADSLKMEVEEADYQIAALSKIVADPGSQLTASTTPITTAPQLAPGYSNSNYAVSYQDALDDIYARKFTEAITKFRQLLQMNDSEGLADNCQYWIGEAYYAQGGYEQAIAEFEKVYAFDNGNKSDDAQFMIGLSYVKLKNPALAQLELKYLMEFYQDSEYIARAEREFGDLSM